MSAPARLYETTRQHTPSTSLVVARISKATCRYSTNSWASCGSLRPTPYQKTQQQTSKGCICHAHDSENGQTTNEASTSARPAPAVASRQQVFTNCSIVSAAFIAVAAAIRVAAPATGPYLFKSNQSAVQALLQSKFSRLICFVLTVMAMLICPYHVYIHTTCMWLVKSSAHIHVAHVFAVSNNDRANHALVSLATAGLVTAARTILLSHAPAFAEATNASNKQVQEACL